jgi:glucose-1-phosphate adenylyltransferase
LHPLTVDTAKPLLPFGAGFCILDFTLSNCKNSGLRQPYLLTQFDAESVQEYVASGRNDAICLPAPYGNSYKGTADAVFHHRRLIESTSPQVVVVLCADHVYKMDYRELLDFHAGTRADVTIAAIEHPIAMAKDFGVISTNAQGRIVRFDEKPNVPNSMPSKGDKALVSMGIYVFNPDVLLREGSRRPANRGSDFGKDVIPELIRSHRVNAYNHTMSRTGLGSYWRDVGALDTYYRSQMDLLCPDAAFDPYNSPGWPIHTAQCRATFHGTSGNGFISDSIMSDDCRTQGARVTRSVVGAKTHVGPGAEVKDSIIMAGARVGRYAKLRRTIVQDGAEIPDNARIGFGLNDDSRQYLVSPEGIVVVDSEERRERFRVAIA